jgi:hypothetical protein
MSDKNSADRTDMIVAIVMAAIMLLIAVTATTIKYSKN